MADFKEIDSARKILGLDECANLEEITKNYRALALKYHPDRCKGKHKKECEEMFKKISHAKNILGNYCAGYRYSFKEKDVKRNSYDKDFYKHLQKFYDGWWGEI
ncbi:MAG: DnaJ domain-containing protein [Candidatus Omnitrophota bacterium]